MRFPWEWEDRLTYVSARQVSKLNPQVSVRLAQDDDDYVYFAGISKWSTLFYVWIIRTLAQLAGALFLYLWCCRQIVKHSSSFAQTHMFVSVHLPSYARVYACVRTFFCNSCLWCLCVHIGQHTTGAPSLLWKQQEPLTQVSKPMDIPHQHTLSLYTHAYTLHAKH